MSLRDPERELLFEPGLARLVKAFRQEVDKVTLEVYTEALCYQVELDEWDVFTLACVRAGRFGKWFPKVDDILEALREFRGEPSAAEIEREIKREAVQAYERVLESPLRAEDGSAHWNYRTVAERCGKAAADAFMAAGGHHAFATSWDEAKRRERFCAEYVAESKAAPDRRLPPPGEDQKAIAGGNEPTRTEAGSFLDQIRAHLPADVELPKPERKARVIDPAAMPERMAKLRAQAEQLAREEAVAAVTVEP